MGQVKPVSFPKFPVKRCVTYKKLFVCYFCSYCRYLDSDMGQFAYFSFTAPLINTWQRIFVFIRVIRGRDQTVPMSLQSVFTLKWPKDKALQAATSSSTSVLSCEHIFYFLFLIKICQKNALWGTGAITSQYHAGKEETTSENFWLYIMQLLINFPDIYGRLFKIFHNWDRLCISLSVQKERNLVTGNSEIVTAWEHGWQNRKLFGRTDRPNKIE